MCGLDVFVTQSPLINMTHCFFARVCVCNLWNHRDPFGLFCFGFASNFTAGGHGHLDGMGQRRPIQAVVKTYLLGAPGRIVRRSWWPPFFLFFCKVLVHLQM